MRRLLHRIHGLLNRRSVETSMDAEMRYHIECAVTERLAAGMSPGEARRAASREFGGIDRHKEVARDERGFRLLDELAQDSRHALRVLRLNPGYTTASVLTFALGIGLTTSIFSVVHGVLLRPLPYAHPDGLAVLWERNPKTRTEQNVVSVPNFEAWRARSRSFAAMAALVPAPVTLSGERPERVMGADVSPGYFHMLGVLPAMGRDFGETDGRAGGARTVVLSDGLWRRQYGADSGIIGRTVSLDEKPFTVLGVMPRDFDPPRFGWLPDHELWFPFQPTEDNRKWGRFLLVVGRLRDGASIEAAQDELAAIAAERGREDPANGDWSAAVVGLGAQITGDVRQSLLVLLGAVGLLLLMAVTNVGSLTIGFMRRRAEEIVVRRAIGANTARLVRQFLTQSAVLGLLGASVGLASAVAGTRALRLLVPPDLPRSGDIQTDAAVLAFTTALTVLATLAFGVTAAVRGLSGDGHSRGATHIPTGRATTRVGNGALVVAEVGLGLVLTVLAGLMVRSFVNLRAVNLGFDTTGVVTARISLPTASYDTPVRQLAFFDALSERLRAAPGVRAVSIATARPFSCCAPVTDVTDPNGAAATGTVTTDVRYVDSSFFAALRIPVGAGGTFLARERLLGTPRVVINKTLAATLWGDARTIGRTLRIDMYNGITAEVIGVVGDVHLADPRTPVRATVYLAADAYPSTVRDVIVRADAEPDAVIRTLRAAVAAIDPRLPLDRVTSLGTSVDRSLARDRFTALILGVFGGVSLLLAAVGIYGVFAGEVVARRKELGIRIALGARRTGIVILVLRRALMLAVAGVLVGVAGGLAVARSMSALVFGIGTSDPASFVGVGALLLAIALAATIVPAVRAARVSPLDVLRTG